MSSQSSSRETPQPQANFSREWSDDHSSARMRRKESRNLNHQPSPAPLNTPQLPNLIVPIDRDWAACMPCTHA
jgi:hypothetical protein